MESSENEKRNHIEQGLDVSKIELPEASFDYDILKMSAWGQEELQMLTEGELAVLAEDLLDWPKRDIKLAAYEELLSRCFRVIYDLLIEGFFNAKKNSFNKDHKELVHAFIAYKLPQVLPKYKKKKGISFKAWLAVVWRNYITDHYRNQAQQNKKHVEFSEDFLGVIGSPLREQQECRTGKFTTTERQARLQSALTNAIESLPDTEQQLVIPYYFQGKQLQDLAEKLCISESNAKIRLYRARCKLRKKLKIIFFDSD